LASMVMNQVNVFLRQRKQHRRWVALFLALACVVAYATVDRLKYDGQALNHKQMELRCTAHGLVAHEHNDDCYDEDGELRCPLPELELHEHDDSCYEEMAALVCDKLESDGHVHDASCYERVRDEEPSCGIENENHEHSDACYGWHEELTCDIPEGEGAHHHGLGCYEIQMALACGLPEVTEEHVHDDDCFVEIDLTPDEVEELVEEREAVEAAAAREEALEELELNGKWNEDLIAAAESQIGETALENYIEWYGADAQANAAFISYCLQLAEVPSKAVARFGDAGEWAANLQENELLHTFENDEPAEGDLLFLRLSEPEEGEKEPLPDHIALFTGLGEVDEMRTFKVIEVWGDRVIAGEYPDDDPALMGFMTMPDAQAWKQAQQNAELPAQRFEGEAGGVKVSVEADAGAFPADTTMVVTTVAAEDLPETVAEAVAGKVSGVEAVDIAFYNKDGEEIEPLIPIRVSMTAPRIAHAEQSQVVHVTDDGEASIVEQTPAAQLDETPAADQVVFDAGGFSVYAIVYTVDFYLGDFEYHLEGGAQIALGELLELLGVTPKLPGGVYGPELVESVVFSDETLVSVEKGETDWLLTSLLPFDTEEKLTIVMADGHELTVKVLDARITTHVITADGGTWEIAVVFDELSGIPEDAVLTAAEIPEGSEEYEAMLAQTAEAIENEGRTPDIRFARFFDVTILDQNGEKLEPLTPVSVTVRYADAVALGSDHPAVVHFAEEGVELLSVKTKLDVEAEQGSVNVFEYTQASFSGIGTITEASTIGDGQYFIITNSDGHMYALSRTGQAVEVRYYSNTQQVEVLNGTNEDDLLWNVRSLGWGYYAIENNGRYLTLDGSVVTGSPANVRADWVGYDPNDSTKLGNGYNFFNTSANVWDSSTWLPLSFSNDTKTYFVGQTTGDPATIRMAKYAINNITPGTLPATETYEGREVNPAELEEWLLSLFDDMPIGYDGFNKTAEVYDYENRIYQIDLTAKSNAQGFGSDMDIAFSVDMSNSMLFPSVLTEIGTIELKQSTLYNTLDESKVYFVISDVQSTATVNALFYEGGKWKYEDASKWARGQRGGNNMDSVVPDWTTKIAGTDTGWYRLYVAEKGYTDYVKDNSSDPVWDNPYNRLAQTRLQIKNVFNYLDVIAKKYHCRVRVGWNGFARDVVYEKANASGNNSEKFDYRAYHHPLQDLETTSYKVIIDQMTTGFGTAQAQTGGGTRPDKAFEDALNGGMGWDDNAQKYLFLITDGAPQGGGEINGQSSTPALALAAAQAYKTQFDQKNIHLVSVGLSTENVKGAADLFEAISYTPPGQTEKMIYQAKDGEALQNALVDALRVLVKKAVTVGTIRDTIHPMFYPVDENGIPFDKTRTTYIDLNGHVTTNTQEPYGKVTWDGSRWQVEWAQQNVIWADEEHPYGWHGTVLVKSQEDFLGGNDVPTNDGDATLELLNAKYLDDNGHWVTKNFKDLMDLDDSDLEPRTAGTPYVNVDDLRFTEEATEWTVYKGTLIDPLTQLKQFFDDIKVEEKIDDNGALMFPLAAENASERDGAWIDSQTPVTFDLKDLKAFGPLTDAEWKDLIDGRPVTHPYSYLGRHFGKITLTLEQTVADGEPGITVDPDENHIASVPGDRVEVYTLKAVYTPDPETKSKYASHIGDFGTGEKGKNTDKIESDNVHVVNVRERWLKLKKTNMEGRALQGAEFLLYAPDGEGAATIKVDGRDVRVTAAYQLTSDAEGWAVLKPVDGDEAVSLALPERIVADASGRLEAVYYLVETHAPAGYNYLPAPLTVRLTMNDLYWTADASVTTPVKPENAAFNRDQTSGLALTVEGSGAGTQTIETDEHTGRVTVVYQILNSNGYELPMTGGPGVGRLTAIGLLLTLGAGFALLRRRRVRL